jgi:hypothetical protein
MGKSGANSSENSDKVSVQQVPEQCPFQGASSASHLSGSFGTVSGSSVEFDFKKAQARVPISIAVPNFKTFQAYPKRGPPHSSTVSQEA